MKVAIIGCGVSGLGAVRRCIEYDIECIAFERTDDIGGTWVLVDNVGTDEYGLPVHSSMYSSLRVISPKDLMEYPGLKHRSDCDIYPSYKEIYRYLHEFANMYNLWSYIKLHHYVNKVKRKNDMWQVTVQDLKLNIEMCYEFDAIFVANGHNFIPSFGNFSGIENFKGISIHSHNYRSPDIFKSKRVLIIGGGATALDLSIEFGDITQVTFLSHHRDFINKIKFPDNVVLKTDVSYVSENTVTFKDGSSEIIDIILFCTGYKYSCSFLDESCGIQIEDKFIYPLYKEMINISEPSMCFLEIMDPFIVFHGVDLQIQVFLKILKGLVHLPPKTEMMRILNGELEEKRRKHIPRNKFHALDKYGLFSSEEYIRDLETFGNIEPLPNFLFKMYEINNEASYHDLRKLKYEILDDDNVIITYP